MKSAAGHHAGKTVLSDRFGITVTFTLPDKETYLRLLKAGRAARADIDPDELKGSNSGDAV